MNRVHFLETQKNTKKYRFLGSHITNFSGKNGSTFVRNSPHENPLTWWGLIELYDGDKERPE
jgi:hypothetical protein